MLSKSNKQEKNRRLEEKNNRFSIRKLTVGTASVLIGAFFMGVNGTQTVHAADTKSETTTVNVNTLEQAPKENVNASLVANVDLGDDLGLGDLLNNYNKQFGGKGQTNTGKEAQQASTSSQATQPTTSSQDKKQDQQSDLDKATDKLVKDAVANLNKDPKADAPKVEVKKTNRTVTRNVDVYEPGVDPNDDFLDKGYYMGTLNMDDMPQTRVTIDDKEYPTLWGSESYDAMSLTDALKGNNWTLADDGTWNHTLPAEPGYTAKIARVKVEVLGGPDGIFTQEQRDEAKKLTDQLNDDIAKNPYEIPAYTISSPLGVTFYVGYSPTKETAKVDEKVSVTLPDASDPDEDYYEGTIASDTINGTLGTNDDGKYTWNNHFTGKAQKLSDVLANNRFAYEGYGSEVKSFPAIKGYTAKIDSVTVKSAADNYVNNEAEVDTLMDELNDKIDANPYEIPAYTTTTPINVTFNVLYTKNTPVKVETRERLDVTLPTSTDPDEDYYYGGINTDANDMSGEKSEDGTYTWEPVEHAALDLNDALSKPDFVYAENGSWHNTLPSIPGYRAYISDVTANSASPMGNDNEAEVDALIDELEDKIHANPYEVPAYTTTTPINVYFYVEYEKVSDNGDVVTTPALPEYKGNVAGIPETRPVDKPFEGGVAGVPLTQDALPEAQVGIAGEPLTQNALPEAQVGVAGEPLTEAALPEAQVGVAGEPLTEAALPEAQVGVAGEPLTQEALPEAQVGIAGEPLTQEALPEAQVGIAGDPLTQDALPEAQVGIAGDPLTQDALPEAQVGVAGTPLTEAALPAYTGDLSTNGDAEVIPALPEAGNDDQNSASDDEPAVTPEVTADDATTVAPHATAAANKVVDNDVEEDTTAPVHSNKVAEDEDQVVAQEATTVASKTETNVATADSEAKRAATLPQTGAKATVAGVLGLMMVGVAAVLSLAVDRKRKN